MSEQCPNKSAQSKAQNQSECNHAVVKSLSVASDESVLALVVHLPEKMDVAMLNSFRARTQEWLENNGLKGLPLMITCGDMRVDVLKVKTEDLATQNDIQEFSKCCKSQVTNGSLADLAGYLRDA